MGLRLRQRLELRSESAQLGTDGSRLSNADMDPVPPDSPQRTWGWPSLLGFWIAEAFSISMYQGKPTILPASSEESFFFGGNDLLTNVSTASLVDLRLERLKSRTCHTSRLHRTRARVHTGNA